MSEPPAVMFRKCMQIDDGVIWRYFDLLSSSSASEIAALRGATVDPREPKRLFALEIVTRFHGADEATKAEEEFRRVYLDKGGLPDDIREITVPVEGDSLWIAKALSAAGLAGSTSEGKRMMKDGWVEVDGTRVNDEQHQLKKGARYLLRTGSKNRKFAYVTVA